MKIISWNVNGIRAVMKKGFSDFTHKTNPDILCLQETKAHPDQVDKLLDNYEHHYWNSADKKG
jgi:exodeoxyribonuclease-3